jgi:hypothetical protein
MGKFPAESLQRVGERVIHDFWVICLTEGLFLLYNPASLYELAEVSLRRPTTAGMPFRKAVYLMENQ